MIPFRPRPQKVFLFYFGKDAALGAVSTHHHFLRRAYLTGAVEMT